MQNLILYQNTFTLTLKCGESIFKHFEVNMLIPIFYFESHHSELGLSIVHSLFHRIRHIDLSILLIYNQNKLMLNR